jgi:hypothetical protein
MPNKEPDSTEKILLIGIVFLLLFAIAYITIDKTNMPLPLYIALLFATTELIYIQFTRLENKDPLKNLKNTFDLFKSAQELKLISIATAIIAIPIITIILGFIISIIIFFISAFKELLTIIIGAIVLIVIWGIYIYINTFPIRLRIKETENDNSRNFGTIFD